MMDNPLSWFVTCGAIFWLTSAVSHLATSAGAERALHNLIIFASATYIAHRIERRRAP